MVEEAIHLQTAIEAIDLAWDNKFKESDEKLEPLKGTVPRLALHYAESTAIISFLTSLPEDIDRALERLKAARKLAETHIKVNKQTNKTNKKVLI